MNFSRKQMAQFMRDNNISHENSKNNALTDDDIRKMMELASEHISHKHKTNDEILTEIELALRYYINSEEEISRMKDRLVGYKLVTDENELELGKYIRWLRTNTGPPYKLTNGGILMGINTHENGNLQILCQNHKRLFTKYNYDDCLTFQKMTDEELLISEAMKIC